MQRYFAINNNLELDKSDIYHIYKVMRMKVNDNIEVVYNKEINVCKIIELSPGNIKLEIVEKKENVDDISYSVTIAVSLVNEQKWDYILQKATELGVNKIIPLSLSRTIVKIDNLKYDKKYERWFKICKEAAEQSHRVTIPNILSIMDIKELLTLDYDLKIVCSTKEDSIKIKQVLSNKQKYGRILIVIGPEGGLTPTEEQTLVQSGFIPTSLGKLIMRVETVPLFILSVINYELSR